MKVLAKQQFLDKNFGHLYLTFFRFERLGPESEEVDTKLINFFY